MSDLLELALNAHGGLERWQAVTSLHARVSLTGPFYRLKGQPDGIKALLRINTRTPSVAITPFQGAGNVGEFRPDGVWITGNDGSVIEERVNPRDSFAGHVLATIWDPLQLLYFNAYATWNYLCTPFLFTYPGFELNELSPHQESNAIWRRLHVKFPQEIPTHCPEQIFYFDNRGLLQRIDYVTEVAGGVATHYCYDHTNFGGLLFPTLRRVVRRTAEGASPAQPTMILIQIGSVIVE
ncbi:hypothetical protein [Acidisoma silvae]|uniref:Uncharacterized protein n=1 Tax=Acidisoma silvae TaxID=2802396 RepID=A0A963YVG5_9PROT|nr:hypothetical protein [Acidisoma silvae]MCB8877843.1 hypothetical protein [Acidisoma silvae]